MKQSLLVRIINRNIPVVLYGSVEESVTEYLQSEGKWIILFVR
ncbi:MAG: hypothetical protein WC295_14080 [Methanoregula sp.]|nr:hypothetical protein [Methanoregula sp.]